MKIKFYFVHYVFKKNLYTQKYVKNICIKCLQRAALLLLMFFNKVICIEYGCQIG